MVKAASAISAKAALAISALVICAPGASPAAGPALRRIAGDELCVTNGIVSAQPDGQLAIDTESSRAVVRNATDKAGDQVAEIRFRYLGPGQTTRPLASGELRRQIGLKLRAQDTCNLVYAMWHIEPDARIAVSIKRNIGMHTQAQCGAGGYMFIKTPTPIEPPPIQVGEPNILRAELHGIDLTVTANGKAVWQGPLGGRLPAGPPGFRTDNGRFTFEFYAGSAGISHLQEQQERPVSSRCVMSAGD